MCGGGNIDFPSPEEIGQAQARFNRLDQYTPYGSLLFTGPDRSTAVQTFSPEMLQLQGAMMGLRSSALNQLLGRYGGSAFSLQNPSDPTTGDPTQWEWDEDELKFKPRFNQLNAIAEPLYNTSSGEPPWGTRQAGERRVPIDPNDPLPPPRRPGGRRVPIDPNDQSPIPDYGQQAYSDIGLPYDLGLDQMGDIVANRERLEDAYYQRAKGLLDPFYADQQAALDQQLANRGMPIGSEETEILQNRLGAERGGAYEKAAMDAILYGGGEVRADRAQTLSEALSQFGAASQARSQLFGEDTTGFNQLASILGLTPTPSGGGDLSSFFGPGSIDMMSPYALQAQMQMANQGFGSDLLGGLLGLGGSIAGGYFGGGF